MSYTLSPASRAISVAESYANFMLCSTFSRHDLGHSPVLSQYDVACCSVACSIGFVVLSAASTRGLLSLAGAGSVVRLFFPRARGLALGYTLSPAGAGLVVRLFFPRARGLALGYTLSPAGAGLGSQALSQGSRTRPGLHALARWRRLRYGEETPRTSALLAVFLRLG